MENTTAVITTSSPPMALKFLKKISIFLGWGNKEVRIIENALTEKKIRDFSKEDSDALCGHLRLIAFNICGIQAPIPVETLAYINRMLNRYYSNLTIADITDAFEMRAAGELGKIDHWGTFSSEFIGAVLRKYCSIRNQAIQRYRTETSKHKKLEEPANYVSNEQVYNSLVIWVKWQKKIPAIWLWDAAHQHLVALKKLNTFEKQTYEQKQSAVILHLKDMFPEFLNK